MMAGDKLVKKEIDEFNQSRQSLSDASSTSSDQYGRTPLSPTTHTLILHDDTDSVPSQQLETFV